MKVKIFYIFLGNKKQGALNGEALSYELSPGMKSVEIENLYVG